MKKTFFIMTIVGAVIFSACKKDDPAPVTPGTITLRYDFTADIIGKYDFTYTYDTAVVYDSVNALTSSRTAIVTRPANSTVDSASYIVFPPADWIGTTTQANVTLKLFVDGVLKADTSARIGGYDRPTGLMIKTTF